MRLIEITDYGYPSYFECTDHLCPFRKECSQHETAGEFRSEDGFTPDLVIIGSLCYCETCQIHPLEENGNIYFHLPENYDDLGHGCLMSNRCGMLVTVESEDSYELAKAAGERTY